MLAMTMNLFKPLANHNIVPVLKWCDWTALTKPMMKEFLKNQEVQAKVKELGDESRQFIAY